MLPWIKPEGKINLDYKLKQLDVKHKPNKGAPSSENGNQNLIIHGFII